MKNKHFHIKNMVCSHCAEVLEDKLTAAGFGVQKIELGELYLSEPVDEEEYGRLISVIRDNGFDLIDDENSRIVEQVKQLIIRQVRSGKPLEKNLSEYLSDNDEKSLSEIALELDYSSQQHFSRQFKQETGLAPSHFKNIKENKRNSIDQL